MIDNEIIKALEQCIKCCLEGDCDKCPFEEQGCRKEYVMKSASDCIKRQQAEIYELQRRNCELEKEINEV